MKVYLDLIIILNFFYDTLIVLAVSVLLRYRVNLKRVFLSSLIGELSLITLFIRLDNIFLLLLKLILSLIMVFLSFGKNNYFNNLFYFYIITIILGGSSYLINGSNMYTNLVLMIILSPIIITLYIINARRIKKELTIVHDVIIVDSDNTIKLRGIMDTGNNVVCPITRLPVVFVSDKLKLESNKLFVVPYRTIDNEGVLNCKMPDEFIMDGIIVKCLVATSSSINTGEVLLNNEMREII